ncbi:MAG: glycosyltransferase family 39 protein [Actinobacteria bacterium]|nr:glycosyltransferase family 39 protein [Actinomycetota bacterium]
MTKLPDSPGLAREDHVPAAGRPDGAAAGSPWLALIPAVVTLGVMLAGIGRPSFWQDEASTLADTQRTLPQMFALLGHIDAVHGAYYVLMWPVVKVAGTSELAARFPSAVAMAVAAGFIALLGRRLVSGRAGVAAGLVFAALPQVSWYGQDARESAVVTAVATVSVYLFVRALGAPAGRRGGWLAGYGASLAVLGLLNLFALLIIPAHGLSLAALRRRGQPGGPQPAQPAAAGTRPLVLGWLTAAAAALAVASPVALAGYGQRSQVAWIRRPTVQTLIGLDQLIGPAAVFGVAILIVAAGVALSATRGRARLRGEWPAPLTAICLPWLVIPPALLLAVSLLHPVYMFRYIVFCIPAAALLIGAALAALGWVVGAAALVLLALLAVPAQVKERAPAGHGENLRLISHILAVRARPGDAVLFGSFYERKIEIAYPAGFRSVRDVSLGKTALQIAEPAGVNAPAQLIGHRLATVTRLWVIRRAGHPEPSSPGAKPGNAQALPPLRHLGFGLERHWTVTGYRISLYVRRGRPPQ